MKTALLLSLCALGLVFVVVLPNADAAVDMFLKIEGVQGESQDSKHKGEIDVLAWSWGMSQSGTTHTGGDRGAARVNVQDLSFVKYVDKSSPILLLRAANGEHFPEATLVVRKAGDNPVEFKKITMTNILVTSISLGGAGGQDRLTENVTFNFQKVTTEYTEQDSKGNPIGDGITFTWNVAENTGGGGSSGGSGDPTTTDSDGDGVPDSSDICQGFNDLIDSDSDGIPNGCDDDDDNDGISDLIDTRLTTPSLDFVSRDGKSSGTITSGGQFLKITEALGSKIKVAATGPATVSACGISEMKFSSGEVEFICGSITILVLSGSVDVNYTTEGFTDTLTATLTAGQQLTFDPIDLSFTVPEGTTATIMVGDQTFTITSGAPFTADIIPPILTVPEDITIEAVRPQGKTVHFIATATDNTDPNPTVDCTPPSGSTFALDENTVTCTATDAAGNSSTATFTVTVVDTTPPNLTVPADLTVEAESPDGAVVEFEATATDLVDPNPGVECTPPSLSTFALDENTITCTATDAAGNSSTATFTVTVVDTTPPNLTVPDNVTAECTSPDGTPVDIGIATAEDIVDLTPSISNDAPSLFQLGQTIVQWTAEDFSNNASVDSQTVTVRDTTEPSLVIPVDFEVEANTSGGWTGDIGDATASDICGDVTISNDAPSVFPLGDTEVVWTAFDENGNSISAHQTITVIPLQITLDIKPGSDNNPINLKSKGVIPVAVISTTDFDATLLDPLLLSFGPGGATESHNKKHLDDVNNDGLDDLVLHFRTQETEIQTELLQLCLSGTTFDGIPVEGCDTFKIIDNGPPATEESSESGEPPKDKGPKEGKGPKDK